MPPADFSLRLATEQDSHAIRALIRRVQINPLGLDWRRFVVAVNSGQTVVGCGQLKRHSGGITELASIAVQPAYRGAGIARAIIESLLARGPRPLYLTCRSSLGGFYGKWGFRALEPSEMPRYFRRLSRLVSALTRLTNRREGLLVMVLQ